MTSTNGSEGHDGPTPRVSDTATPAPGVADTDSTGWTVTWAELLAEATEQLAIAGVDSAAMDARRIVAEASGIEVSAMPMGLDALATQRAVAHLDDMIRRRSAGEPLQYVLGSWGFRSLDLMIDRRVLIPRPETESVVDHALAELDRVGGRERPTTVVDIGTGSGAIALSIAAERLRAQVVATDVSADALAVASANTVGVGRPGTRVQLLQGDLYAALPDDLAGAVDLIVSNPPYVATRAEVPDDVTRWEPPEALWAGEDGTLVLRRLVVEAPTWLAPHGALVAELSPEQAAGMAELARRYFRHVEVAWDLAGRERALVARAPRTESSDG